MRSATFWITCSCAIFFNACAHIPAHTFSATPVTVPIPVVQSQATLTIANSDLRVLESLATEHLKPRIDQERVPGGCLNPCFHFEKTMPGVLRLQSGQFVLRGEYRGEVETKGDAIYSSWVDCKLSPFNLGVSVTGMPRLVHEGADWFLALPDSAVVLSRLPGTDTRCTLPLALPFVPGLIAVDINVKDKIDESFRAVGSTFAKELAKEKIKLPIDNIDAKLRGPLEIPIGESGDRRKLCVYPRLISIGLGSVQGWPMSCVGLPFCNAIDRFPPEEESLQQVTVPIFASLAPSALLTQDACPDGGEAPAAGATINANPRANDPFRIVAAVGLEYEALSKTVTDELRSVKGNSGAFKLPFKPKDVRLGDAGGQLFVQVDLQGSLKGRIYFWGEPKLSEDREILRLEGLHLAAESRGALAGLNIRLPDLVTNLFLKRLDKALTFEVEKLTGQLLGANGKTVAFPGGALVLSDLKITDVNPQSIPSQLRISATLTGRATGSVRPSPE
jgi:hypothetical protein